MVTRDTILTTSSSFELLVLCIRFCYFNIDLIMLTSSTLLSLVVSRAYILIRSSKTCSIIASSSTRYTEKKSSSQIFWNFFYKSFTIWFDLGLDGLITWLDMSMKMTNKQFALTKHHHVLYSFMTFDANLSLSSMLRRCLWSFIGN